MATKKDKGIQVVPAWLRDAAALWALTVALFGVAGLVWGLFYPMMRVRVGETVQVLPASQDASFRALVWFVGMSAALGVVLGVWAHHFFVRGLGQLLWVVVCMFLGAWWFVFVGAQVLPDPPNVDAASPGDVIELARVISPWPGMLVAPGCAALAYWLGEVMDG